MAPGAPVHGLLSWLIRTGTGSVRSTSISCGPVLTVAAFLASLKAHTKGAKNNYVSQATGGGQSGQTISTNHFPKGDSRLSWASTRSMASLVRVTPVWYVVVTSSTTGWVPFQVMVRANPTTASSESSNDPFQ